MALSTVERAERLVDEVNDQIGDVKVTCGACGKTVAYVRLGIVAHPSKRRPALRVRCFRAGCRYETLVILDEVIAA